MRACASAASVVLALGGCQPPRGDFGFSLEEIALRAGHQAVQVDYDQSLQLSREASDALAHGVPLTITVDLELRQANSLNLLASQQERYVVRYLPLSRHYELAGPGKEDLRTFPRLRHALAEIGDARILFNTGALAPGDYEFRTRVRLDTTRMPAPMRLPALMSGQWHHDSDWSTWPFVVGA